jgi:membrane protein DedA with SNARE-associated domain
MFMDWMIEYGLWSLAFLMLLQNLIPFIPSEVIMPLAGFLASMGYLDMGAAIAAGLLGSLIGHLPWYAAGRLAGERRLNRWAARHGRWFGLGPAHVRRACAWFRRRAGSAVLLGRLVPGLRTVVNIPAGAARMPLLPFLGYTLLGDALWTALLAWAGWSLGGRYALVSWYLHVLMAAAFLVAAAGVLLWLRSPGRRGLQADCRHSGSGARGLGARAAFRRRPFHLKLPGMPPMA